MDGPHATPGTLSTDPAFGYLASSLAQLLEVVRRELEHDREAAKASLAAASTILQSEIERHSGAKQSVTAGLTGWQIARVRAFIDKNLHRTNSYPGSERGRAAKPGSFLPVVQVDIWRTAARLRDQEAPGESLQPHGDQSGFAERNSSERGVFGSGAPLQVVQASLRPKPGQLAARARDAIRWLKPGMPAQIRNIPWATRTGKF